MNAFRVFCILQRPWSPENPNAGRKLLCIHTYVCMYMCIRVYICKHIHLQTCRYTHTSLTRTNTHTRTSSTRNVSWWNTCVMKVSHQWFWRFRNADYTTTEPSPKVPQGSWMRTKTKHKHRSRNVWDSIRVHGHGHGQYTPIQEISLFESIITQQECICTHTLTYTYIHTCIHT